jgi:hypothetical protein
MRCSVVFLILVVLNIEFLCLMNIICCCSWLWENEIIWYFYVLFKLWMLWKMITFGMKIYIC